jgi:hypothetical protein
VRLPAADFAEVRDCAEFVFEWHNARLTLAQFVTRRSWDKVQEKYRWVCLASFDHRGILADTSDSPNRAISTARKYADG